MLERPFSPPFSASDLLSRGDLLKQMRTAARTGKHIALIAPGGYGKTVTATQLLADTSERQAVWLTLSAADNQPDHLYARLLAAICQLLGAKAPGSSTGLEAVLAAAASLPLRGGRRFLALDDVHVLHNPDSLRLLPLLLAALPRIATALLCSRAALPPALLENSRGFLVLRSEDLAFTPEESAWFLPKETQEQVHHMWLQTGGWAIGLHALALEDSHMSDGPAPSTLAGYLDAGVWNQWSESDQMFLLRCALPPEVNPPLAKLLTGADDGMQRLEALQHTGAFLSRTTGDSWRFHDLFRAWLNGRALVQLGQKETVRLRTAAANWYFEQDNFYTAARLYILNGDHEGINVCMRTQNSFGGNAQDLSVENKVNFINTYVEGLAPAFIKANPYLLSRCTTAAFHNGQVDEFARYADALMAMLPQFAATHPDLAQTAGFVHGLDYRVPLRDICKEMATMARGRPAAPAGQKGHAAVASITQNLPLMHRSMRDYAEYHALDSEDMALLRATYGVMIGPEYDSLEGSLIAGVWYERGNLQQANHHALLAVRACGEDTQAETVLCAHMMLAAVYDALGATRQAGRLYAQMEAFTETPQANFLQLNFKAMAVSRTLRQGDIAPAQNWLAMYAATADRLPFYQMCRHFATLRAHLALGQNETAAEFGTALLHLAESYRRPVDQIESGLLAALALWRAGQQPKALEVLAAQVETARHYDFVQQFVNEGRDMLPLVWALQKRRDMAQTPELKVFLQRISTAIYDAYDFSPEQTAPVSLPPKQLAMLRYLQKGMSYSQMAQHEGTGHGTVKSHVLQMYKKLDVHTAEEAIAKAKMLGLLK